MVGHGPTGLFSDLLVHAASMRLRGHVGWGTAFSLLIFFRSFITTKITKKIRLSCPRWNLFSIFYLVIRERPWPSLFFLSILKYQISRFHILCIIWKNISVIIWMKKVFSIDSDISETNDVSRDSFLWIWS